MYDVSPNATLGFHGCEQSVADKLLNIPDDIKISRERFDWLGHGLYFWENNITRARIWAERKKQRGEIENPAVIGAVLQLGYCCDLLDSRYIRLLNQYHALMKKRYDQLGLPLPENKDVPNDEFKDKILRDLDCAVIQFMHSEMLADVKDEEKQKGFSKLRLFDSVRGAFTEGGKAFTGAGIFERSHIQICVRNFNCIKGFFKPRKEIDFREWLEHEV